MPIGIFIQRKNLFYKIKKDTGHQLDMAAQKVLKAMELTVTVAYEPKIHDKGTLLFSSAADLDNFSRCSIR